MLDAPGRVLVGIQTLAMPCTAASVVFGSVRVGRLVTLRPAGWLVTAGLWVVPIAWMFGAGTVGSAGDPIVSQPVLAFLAMPLAVLSLSVHLGNIFGLLLASAIVPVLGHLSGEGGGSAG